MTTINAQTLSLAVLQSEEMAAATAIDIFDVFGVVTQVSAPGTEYVNTSTGEVYTTSMFRVRLHQPGAENPDKRYYNVPASWKASGLLEEGAIVHLVRRKFSPDEAEALGIKPGVWFDMSSSWVTDFATYEKVAKKMEQ